MKKQTYKKILNDYIVSNKIKKSDIKLLLSISRIFFNEREASLSKGKSRTFSVGRNGTLIDPLSGNSYRPKSSAFGDNDSNNEIIYEFSIRIIKETNFLNILSIFDKFNIKSFSHKLNLLDKYYDFSYNGMYSIKDKNVVFPIGNSFDNSTGSVLPISFSEEFLLFLKTNDIVLSVAENHRNPFSNNCISIHLNNENKDLFGFVSLNNSIEFIIILNVLIDLLISKKAISDDKSILEIMNHYDHVVNFWIAKSNNTDKIKTNQNQLEDVDSTPPLEDYLNIIQASDYYENVARRLTSANNERSGVIAPPRVVSSSHIERWVASDDEYRETYSNAVESQRNGIVDGRMF